MTHRRWSLARQIDEEYVEDEDPFADLGQLPTVEYSDEALRILSEPESEE